MEYCCKLLATVLVLVPATGLSPAGNAATPYAPGTLPLAPAEGEIHSLASMCSVSGLDGPGYRYSDSQVQDMVRESEVVVRAVAADSLGQSYNREYEWHFELIRFEASEVLRGTLPDSEFNLEGFIVDRDEFNSASVPYGHVRASGSGPCFAYGYRLGAEYLFLLNRVEGSDSLTPYWIPLGPTNEQIRGADDPWVRWVREQLAEGAEQ